MVGEPSDAGLSQAAMASLNALLDVTGGLVQHGRRTDDELVNLNFLAVHELRVRTLQLFGKAESMA